MIYDTVAAVTVNCRPHCAAGSGRTPAELPVTPSSSFQETLATIKQSGLWTLDSGLASSSRPRTATRVTDRRTLVTVGRVPTPSRVRPVPSETEKDVARADAGIGIRETVFNHADCNRCVRCRELNGHESMQWCQYFDGPNRCRF